MIMRRISILYCLLVIFLPLAAQMPDWYNVASRKMHYPPETYYTGFAEGSKQNNESLEEALSRLKDAARVELVSTIRTSVEQTMQNNTQSVLQQNSAFFDEQIQETLSTETRISSSLRDVSGLKVEVYHNAQNNEIVAFAYVKRATLISQWTRGIALELGRTEGLVSQARQLISNGQNMPAREMVETGLAQISRIEEIQSLLAVVDETADEESLQLLPTRSLKQTLTELAAQLRNAVTIYLHCDAKLFDKTYDLLKGQIESSLSEMSVSFVDNANDAMWAIYVTASAREGVRSVFGNYSNYSAFVDAHIDIDQKTTGRRIYSNGFSSSSASHTHGFEQAAREAYKEITPRIQDIIKQQIAD